MWNFNNLNNFGGLPILPNYGLYEEYSPTAGAGTASEFIGQTDINGYYPTAPFLLPGIFTSNPADFNWAADFPNFSQPNSAQNPVANFGAINNVSSTRHLQLLPIPPSWYASNAALSSAGR